MICNESLEQYSLNKNEGQRSISSTFAEALIVSRDMNCSNMSSFSKLVTGGFHDGPCHQKCKCLLLHIFVWGKSITTYKGSPNYLLVGINVSLNTHLLCVLVWIWVVLHYGETNWVLQSILIKITKTSGYLIKSLPKHNYPWQNLSLIS